jgi:hypothetical protein
MQHIFQQIYFQIVSAGLGRFALNLPFHIFLVNFININFAQNESLKIDIDLELIRRLKRLLLLFISFLKCKFNYVFSSKLNVVLLYHEPVLF